MANVNVVKLKDREGNHILPVTRSTLVQAARVSSIDITDWDNVSVQTVLEKLGTAYGNVKLYVDAQDTAYLNTAKTYAGTVSDAAYTNAKNYSDATFIKGIKLGDSASPLTPDANRIVNIGELATSEGLSNLTDAVGELNDLVEDIAAAYVSQTSLSSNSYVTQTSLSANSYVTQTALSANSYVVQSSYDNLEDRVEATESAITTLNGNGEGSVSKAVADGIASVVASAPEKFDTLQEIAYWIENDPTGATAMQNAITKLNGDASTTGSVANQIKTAKDTIDNYTINGQKISTNPVLDATYIAYVSGTSVKQAIENLNSSISNVSAGMTTIKAKDAATESYLTVDNTGNAYTLQLTNIASATNLDALQTSYNALNTSYNNLNNTVNTLIAAYISYDNLGVVEDVTLTF